MRLFQSETLNKYCYDLLTAVGVDRECAQVVADAMLDAELTGVSTHGVIRLPIYIQRIKAGLVSTQNNIKILCENPSTVVIDAGNTMGAPSAVFAMETCVRKAAKTGACFATVKGSIHFGTVAFYTKIATKHDMIGFACTNVKGKIVPYGGTKPYMGTNPFSIAIPSEGDPFIFDMTPTVVALGKLIIAQKRGERIPLGWALDENGQPTTDPAAGRRGSLVPIAGPKGSGLAMAVELLCGVLSGAGCGPHLHDLYSLDAPQGLGHFMGAINVSCFMDPNEFKLGVSQMMREIKQIKPADGFNEIRIPGEKGVAETIRQQKEGITLPEQVWQELTELGKPYGLTL